MSEAASEIFDCLPLFSSPPENEYIFHLWDAFSALDEGDPSARPFALMPFHLLFMLALQYKVLRISEELTAQYQCAFTIKNLRDDQKAVLDPQSPFVIALLNESEIINLFGLIELPPEEIQIIKKLIRNRNVKAHAQGGIEPDLEVRVGEYLEALKKVQGRYKTLNKEVARSWLDELEEGEYGEYLEQFLENRLVASHLCPRDFGNVIEDLLEYEQLHFEQWKQIVGIGLRLAYNQTISVLRIIAQENIDDAKRFNAIRVLRENGEIDVEFSEFLLEQEGDPEIIELLQE